MSEIAAKIEALLLLSARPVSFHKLAGILGIKELEAREAIEELVHYRNVPTSGIHVIVGEGAVELGTNPAFAEVISSMTKEETASELTRPQLETLTIIAYRGPVTKNEVEYIRGVNCSLIIRNLLMRGLIVEREEEGKIESYFTVSTEMLRHLGIHSVAELPDYESLHKHAKINEMLEAAFQKDV
ncbi:MAG: SMC-Scp complex subunit ScpB [Patescibacteria group bacterium]